MILRAFSTMAVLLCSGNAVAASVSYVRASSQYMAKEDQGRYHPLNLFDDDASTVWCASKDLGQGESIEIVFSRRQKIDRVAINPTAKSGRVVEAVRISDGTSRVTVKVGTAPVAEIFNKPLEGTRYTIEIETLGEATSGEGTIVGTACLADAVLYLRNAYLGGGATKLRYDPNIDRLVGAWQGGALGAPEQSLVFSLDGSWQWTYTPLLNGKPKRLAGEYRFRGERLFMRVGAVGRWVDMQYQRRRVRVDREEMGAPSGDYDLITLGGKLNPALGGDYNNARFD